MKFANVIEAIGNTPHIKLNQLFDDKHEVWMKVERFNPGGSIKDRIALGMIEAAEKSGDLKAGGHIVEPTSGNTGIGLAMVAAVKGYQLTLVMPESMSIERRKIMKAYGAELVLTPKEQGMGGAIAKAKEIAENLSNAWIPQQFENPANVNIHIQTTAKEIANDFPEGLDYLITGVGTGGHITGCAKVLKERFPNLKVLAVEPEKSPVISGGEKGLHKLQGIGAGFIPKNLDTALLDGVVQVSEEAAFEYCRQSALKEGLFVGISSGASLAAVQQTLAETDKPVRVLVFSYDTGERYLSMEGLFDA